MQNLHQKLSTKTHLPLPLPLTLNHFSPPPLIISLTKIAFNSGDTSLNGIVMGFPPLSTPVLLETAFPCHPVALFGACCAMSLEAAVSLAGFSFRASTIDLARSSWWLRLHFGICCLSGSGFICNESSDIETLEGVATTNSQSEISRCKQCKSVSKKSGGLNLSLYHLEWNVHPATRLWSALGLVRVQYQSVWQGRFQVT